MARKSGGRRPDFVGEALEFANENGMDALTVRALGDRMGMHFTAVYRHYPSKEALIAAMLDRVIGQAIDEVTAVPADPEERLVDLARTLRQVMAENPALAVAAVRTDGQSSAVLSLADAVTAALVDLGLSGRALVVGYQMLESYVMGATVYDFAEAPDHLAIRRQRHRKLANPTFREVLIDDDDVEAVNEEAFISGLRALIAALRPKAL